MKLSQRILIVLLVSLAFSTGIVARQQCNVREKEIARRQSISNPINAEVASTDLDIDFRPIETLYSVLRAVRENYVEQITAKDERNMTYDALRSMLAALGDPNTRFLAPEQRKLISDAALGKFHGIGAALAVKRIKANGTIGEHLIVISTLPNSPASSAGIQPGDDIVEIDGKSVLPFDPYSSLIKEARSPKLDRKKFIKRFETEQKRIESGMTVVEADDMLQLSSDKARELTIISKATSKRMKVKVEPADFTLKPVEYSQIANGDFGLIRINYLGSATAQGFDEAMREVASSNAKGLVIDLRNASGGQMNTALEVAKWFLPGKKMTTVLRSRGRKVALNTPSLQGSAWKGPLVVLVNRGTARTPEVLVSALKDVDHARIVGSATCGDFVENTLIDHPDGSAITMTTGEYLTTAGNKHLGKGVAVDVQATGNDVLPQAIKLLRSERSGS